MNDPVVARLLRETADRLREAGVASPDHDAAELMAHVLGVDRGRLPLVGALTLAQRRELDQLVARRATRIPLQHLIGTVGFRYVELAVGPGVFVPRPETELLAGWAVERATAMVAEGRTEPVVVDLCTGSGAIAAAIAAEVPSARVHAVELDPGALVWAERNLAGTGVRLEQGDLATALPELDGTADVVVCNPPYVPLAAWESVTVEARDHDPHLALFSGEDGLDALRAVETRAARLLRPGGELGVEHADVQGEAAPELVAGTGRWTQVRDHRDLAGRPRFVTARLAR